MDNEELLGLQNDAYQTILERIVNEDDPEKLQQLANAAAQLEKGRNDAQKIFNEHELNEQKLKNDEKNREEDNAVAEKQRKSDLGHKVFEGVLAIASLATAVMLGFRTKDEEENSYVKNPKTDMKAEKFLDRVTRRR